MDYEIDSHWQQAIIEAVENDRRRDAGSPQERLSAREKTLKAISQEMHELAERQISLDQEYYRLYTQLMTLIRSAVISKSDQSQQRNEIRERLSAIVAELESIQIYSLTLFRQVAIVVAETNEIYKNPNSESHDLTGAE